MPPQPGANRIVLCAGGRLCLYIVLTCEWSSLRLSRQVQTLDCPSASLDRLHHVLLCDWRLLFAEQHLAPDESAFHGATSRVHSASQALPV